MDWFYDTCDVPWIILLTGSVLSEDLNVPNIRYRMHIWLPLFRRDLPVSFNAG